MVIINGICYIIGASCIEKQLEFRCNGNDFVIAADGGYDLLKKSGINADVVIGDFDSVSSPVEHNCVITHPVEKDDTDSFLAYRLGYEKGYRSFVIYGGTGGRTDHTIANMQMLCNMAKHGARGFLIGENTVITAICNSKIHFTDENKGKFGVFAFCKEASGVSIANAKYTLDNGNIEPDFPIGVSNEFIGLNTAVSVSDGTLVIVFYETQKEFLRNIKIYTEDLL